MAAPFKFWKYWNFWITATLPKLWLENLTNMTELYPFLESKKWYLLFKGILWWRELLVKKIIFAYLGEFFRTKLTDFNAFPWMISLLKGFIVEQTGQFTFGLSLQKFSFPSWVTTNPMTAPDTLKSILNTTVERKLINCHQWYQIYYKIKWVKYIYILASPVFQWY